jgi:hypothetical protein
MVTQQGEIRSLSQEGEGEVAITVPEGKLAAPSLYWYKRDPELFQAEVAAMNHFFPQLAKNFASYSWKRTVQP